jgi:hypothetical protein
MFEFASFKLRDEVSTSTPAGGFCALALAPSQPGGLLAPGSPRA